MDHDVRSLQAFMEARFDALEVSQERMHGDNLEKLSKIDAKVSTTNGRVTKLEIAVAVIKFAVFTIGGGLVVAGLQIIIAKVTGP